MNADEYGCVSAVHQEVGERGGEVIPAQRPVGNCLLLGGVG